MLDITTETSEEAWHVQERIPLTYVKIGKVTEIQASGHELQEILALFKVKHTIGLHVELILTIPASNTNFQRWFGDTAKTIVAALAYKWGCKKNEPIY